MAETQPLTVTVEKRDGTQETFMRDKVKNSVIKAGGTPEQAETVTVAVESWVQGAAVEGVIKSADIRVKVLEQLRQVNPEAATAFESYKKPAA